jgi:hypothetical protein
MGELDLSPKPPLFGSFLARERLFSSKQLIKITIKVVIYAQHR